MRARRLLGWANLVLASALMLVVWVLLVWVSSRPALRKVFDVSPGQRFSVGPVTEELLREVRRRGLQVEFHTFLQPLQEMPQGEQDSQAWQIVNRLQQLTADLLVRYRELGGEAVRIVHHDLFRPRARTQEAAQRFGVRGDGGDTVVVVVEGRHKRLSLEGDLGVIDIPARRQQGTGLPTSALPILKDFKGEEALSSALKGLLVQGTPVVCFLRGYQEADTQSATIGGSYGLFRQALTREGIEVRDLELAKDAAIPDDASVLVLLEPRYEFTDRHAQQLHAWLRRGGRLFLNYSWINHPDWNPTGGELGRLLGFEIGREVVFHRIPNPGRPGWGLDGDPDVRRLDLHGLNPSHPVTRPLALARRHVQLVEGRELRVRTDAPDGVTAQDLLLTGPLAWLAPGGPEGPDLRGPLREDAYGPRTVGIAIEVEGEQPGRKGIAVVVSAIGFTNAGMQVNGDLGLNIVNWLAERKELVTVRGSRYEARHLELKPQQLDSIWWLLVAGVPGLFLLLGFAVKWIRSRV